jgi:hypothetical protein
MPKVLTDYGDRLHTLRGMLYVGVDPGAGGGIAVLGQDSSPGRPPPVQTYKMSNTPQDLWDLMDRIRETATRAGGCFALLEQVGGYAGKGEGAKGGGAANGSAMFKFGHNAGCCEMALTAAGISFETWTPGKWLKALGVPGRKAGEKRAEWKNRLRRHAQRLFPRENITLAVSDALLIAEACRRYRQAVPSAVPV